MPSSQLANDMLADNAEGFGILVGPAPDYTITKELPRVKGTKYLTPNQITQIAAKMEEDWAAGIAEAKLNRRLLPSEFAAVLELLDVTTVTSAPAFDAIPDLVVRATERGRMFNRLAPVTRDDALFNSVLAAMGIDEAARDSAWNAVRDFKPAA